MADLPRTMVVMPAHDEARRFRPDEIDRSLAARPWLRFLLVDDGSRDSTGELLDEVASRHPGRVESMHLSTNRGKANAVREGVLAALDRDVDLIGYWDADLATPLSELDPMCRVLASTPAFMVMGVRIPLAGRRVERRPARRALGLLFAAAAGAALGVRLHDTQCGAKLFRSGEVARWTFAAPFTARWIFDVEILERLAAYDRCHGTDLLRSGLVEHPLQEWREVAGSRLRPRDFVRAALDLAAVARRARGPGSCASRCEGGR